MKKKGFNQISTKYFKPYNTGEEFKLPLQNNYFYMSENGNKTLISKYEKNIEFNADDLIIENRKVYESEGILVNYGDCKPIEYRKNIYYRRKKAWENGLNKEYGSHYKISDDRNWKWNKSELFDIRKTNYFKLLKKIIN